VAPGGHRVRLELELGGVSTLEVDEVVDFAA
jgi:hypothetical protein